MESKTKIVAALALAVMVGIALQSQSCGGGGSYQTRLACGYSCQFMQYHCY